jgi:hypothetical protein
MVYFILSTTANIACSEMNYYFVFLTNMTFAVQLMYSVFYFTRLFWVKVERWYTDTDERRLIPASSPSNIGVLLQPALPWPEKIIYVMANIVLLVPYAITFAYWIFLHTDGKIIN